MAVGTVVLLTVQNILGTFLNLFVTLNDTSEYAGVFAAMFGSAAGVLHVVVAVLLLISLAVVMAVAWPTHRWQLRAPALAALVSFLVAGYSGFHFVASQNNIYSFSMELGFLGVLLSEVALLHVIGYRPSAPERTARPTIEPTRG